MTAGAKGTVGRQGGLRWSGFVKIGHDHDLLIKPMACNLMTKARSESPGDHQHPVVAKALHQYNPSGSKLFWTKRQSGGLEPSWTSPSATKSKSKRLLMSTPTSRKKASCSMTCVRGAEFWSAFRQACNTRLSSGAVTRSNDAGSPQRT